MTATNTLLQRIHSEPELADLLDSVADFDVRRLDPVEELALPGGVPLTLIAGGAGGDSYYLVGEPDDSAPVLFASSEGSATLLGDTLEQALTVLSVLPFWPDLAGVEVGYAQEPAAELEAEYIEDIDDYAELRDRLHELLGLTDVTFDDAFTTLREAADRTDPDFLPVAVDVEDSRYEPIFEA